MSTYNPSKIFLASIFLFSQLLMGCQDNLHTDKQQFVNSTAQPISTISPLSVEQANDYPNKKQAEKRFIEKELLVQDDDDHAETIPSEGFCPITQEIVEDPVIAQNGCAYERSAIKCWFDLGNETSPKTGARVLHTELTPNHSIHSLISCFKSYMPPLANYSGMAASTSTVSSNTSLVDAQLSMDVSLQTLIFKIAERESPLWYTLMIEGGLQEEASRAALVDMQFVLLEKLNRALRVNHNNLGIAIKDAISNNLLEKSPRSIYVRINEAAEKAKAAQETNNRAVVTSEIHDPSLAVKKWNKQAIDQLVVQASKGDKSAFKTVLTIAEENDGYAQYNLGVMYHTGQGVEKDYKQAASWYEKAAEQGNASAPYNLGAMYHIGQGVEINYKQAIYWYKKAVDQGYASAQNNLGWMYANAQGLKKNYKQAVYWYEKAAEQGNVIAQNNLDWMYKNGLGIEKDYKQAMYWYQKAADQGDAKAQYNLGVMYHTGQGVDKDYKKAVYWCQKAADQDHLEAQCELAYMCLNGLGIEKDYKQAVYWCQKAAKKGNTWAQYNLGVMYHAGLGIEEDHKQAVFWYQEAAVQGYAKAQYNLGVMYHAGLGVEKDYKQAVYWYQKAADQGDAWAQRNLGYMYDNGLGVDKNIQQAVYWYQQAANQGDAKAQNQLDKIAKAFSFDKLAYLLISKKHC